MLQIWDEEFFMHLCRRRDVDEDTILCYISQINSESLSYTDEWGQNMLHIASSHGRKNTCVKLLESISDQSTDYFKWTPLHRAIYHGHLDIALLLHRDGLFNKMDNEGHTPLDLLALDTSEDESSPSILFSWGTNVNYNLGLGSKESKLSPEIHEFYRKNSVNPLKVQIRSYQSGVLSTKGVMYLAGYGSSGRLGNGKDCSPHLTPKNMFPDNQVLDFALGRDHSLFLVRSNAKNLIYATGSNSQRQLGIKGDELTVFSPKALTKTFNETIIGVGASDNYSCCWSRNLLYAWGLNVGQMGFQVDENDPCVDSPRLVFSLVNEMSIASVYTSDCSILILTQNSKLILFRDYDIRRIHVPIKCIQKVQLIEQYCPKAQKCIRPLVTYILSQEGHLYSWTLDSGLIRCIPHIFEERIPLIKDFFVSQENIFIVSSDTHFLYQSSSDIDRTPVKKTKKESCRRFKVSRIAKANKVQSVVSDARGLNFFIGCSCSDFKETLKSSVKLPTHQDRLSVDDSLKDGCVIVKSRRFDFHTALLQRDNPLLASKVLQSPESTHCLEELNEENDAEDLFEKMIISIYEEVPSELSSNKRFKRLAKKCGFFGGLTKKKTKAFTNRSCKVIPDACLISSDGVEFPIHRIVLCQKSEYFSAMFRFGTWSESQKDASIKLQIDSKILRAIMDYLYSDIIPHNLIEDAEDISNLILVSNQFFIPKLAFVCENLLTKSLNVRNALKVFQFATDFALERVCQASMRFICLNMGYFYESGRLGSLDETNLDDLCEYYRNEYFSEARQNSRNFTGVLDYSNGDAFEEYEQLINNVLTNPQGAQVSKKKKKTPLRKKSPKKRGKVVVDTKEPEVLNFSLEMEEDSNEEDIKEGQQIYEEEEEGKKMARWVRKSQRERKNEAKKPSAVLPPVSQWPGWKINNDDFTVLSPSADYSELKSSEAKMSRVSKSSWRSLSFTDEEESPTKSCPWIASPQSLPASSSLESPGVSFENILKDEKQKMKATSRIKRKSLRVTQIEDKAIEDLMAFYGADLLSDETIYVERSVDTTKLDLAPVWLKGKAVS